MLFCVITNVFFYVKPKIVAAPVLTGLQFDEMCVECIVDFLFIGRYLIIFSCIFIPLIINSPFLFFLCLTMVMSSSVVTCSLAVDCHLRSNFHFLLVAKKSRWPPTQVVL